jgi:hypothetical protein
MILAHCGQMIILTDRTGLCTLFVEEDRMIWVPSTEEDVGRKNHSLPAHDAGWQAYNRPTPASLPFEIAI